jgi:predicted transcriptional regulator
VALGRKPSEVRVSDIMSTELRTVTLETSFYDCLDLMSSNAISHLFILDEDGDYHGMLAWSDLQRILIGELKYQLKVAQEYAFGHI